MGTPLPRVRQVANALPVSGEVDQTRPDCWSKCSQCGWQARKSHAAGGEFRAESVDSAEHAHFSDRVSAANRAGRVDSATGRASYTLLSRHPDWLAFAMPSQHPKRGLLRSKKGGGGVRKERSESTRSLRRAARRVFGQARAQANTLARPRVSRSKRRRTTQARTCSWVARPHCAISWGPKNSREAKHKEGVGQRQGAFAPSPRPRQPGKEQRNRGPHAENNGKVGSAAFDVGVDE